MTIGENTEPAPDGGMVSYEDFTALAVERQALLAQLSELRGTVARLLPDDSDMIEHNPDEGMRMFCCGGEVVHVWGGNDRCEHATGCWYVALGSLAALSANPSTT